MNKYIIFPALALVLGGGLFYGATRVNAFGMGVDSSSPIVQKLVEKFGLNVDDVTATFQELRDEHQAQMQANREERLNQAVSDGVITEEQKQAILTKQQEMQQEREQHHEEMQAWFQEQGIDQQALFKYGGFGHGGMRGLHRYAK